MKDVRKDILRIALPSMGSSVFNTLYSLVDLMWIGRMGKEAVASVTLAASLYNMNYIINEIFGVSSMVMLSRRWGEGNKKDFEDIGRQIVTYKFFAGFILLLITYPVAPLLLSWLGSGKIPSQDAISYYRIRTMFLPLSFLLGTMMTTFRSIGDTRTLFFVTAAGSIANIFLDPLFMFVMNMGVSGSALASGMCESSVMLLGFFMAKKKWKVWLLRMSKLKLSTLKKILYLGGPSLADSVNWNFSRMIVVRMFSGYGVLATATFGIFARVIDITWMVGFAIEGAVTTLVGQSLGKRDKGRAVRVFIEGRKIALIIGATASIFVFILSTPISQLFSEDLQLVRSSSAFLRYTSFLYIFMYLVNISYGTLTGGGRTIDALYISIITNWVFRIPVMALLKYLGFGYNALGIVISLSVTLGSMVGLLMVRKKRWLDVEI